jgi:hypothetical protein
VVQMVHPLIPSPRPFDQADVQVITFVGCIILSAWPASFGLKMLGYFLLWLNNAGGPILIVSPPIPSLKKDLELT